MARNKISNIFLYSPLITEDIFLLCVIHNIHFTSFLLLILLLFISIHVILGFLELLVKKFLKKYAQEKRKYNAKQNRNRERHGVVIPLILTI